MHKILKTLLIKLMFKFQKIMKSMINSIMMVSNAMAILIMKLTNKN